MIVVVVRWQQDRNVKEYSEETQHDKNVKEDSEETEWK